MLNRALTFSLIGGTLLTSAALAQTTPPSSTGSTASPAGPTQFLTQEKAGEWRAAKLKGVKVYNNDHQRVGEIRDVLVDPAGKIDAVVIGVGGFLGIHEHDVAVPFDQLSWVQPKTPAGASMPRPYPDRVVINMSKDRLKAAPEFHYAS